MSTEIQLYGKEWLLRKQGPSSYWLCYRQHDADADMEACLRIDYPLFKELIAWRGRRLEGRAPPIPEKPPPKKLAPTARCPWCGQPT